MRLGGILTAAVLVLAAALSGCGLVADEDASPADLATATTVVPGAGEGLPDGSADADPPAPTTSIAPTTTTTTIQGPSLSVPGATESPAGDLLLRPLEVPGTVPPQVVTPDDPKLTPGDRAAITLCGQVQRLQLAGVEFVQASATPTASMGPFLQRIIDAVGALSVVAPPSSRAILERVASQLVSAQPEISGAPDLDSIRSVVGAAAPDVTKALRELVFVCPAQIEKSSVDQAERLQPGRLLIPG